MCCASANQSDCLGIQAALYTPSTKINRLLLLWGAGGPRSSSTTTSPHRAVVVSDLSLDFLSRPVEMGLMKRSTLSESCLNIGCGIHLQLVPAEADHHTSTYTFVLCIPPLAFPYTACQLFLHP
ncbi:hypothetical protein VZT92_000517 [Zoarces viviparus]|uniref:Uncharacterized protein n=1 Tax=Zoarces viviparus TaxID=48416 RepID=A0AAW1G799_ZOAVI